MHPSGCSLKLERSVVKKMTTCLQMRIRQPIGIEMLASSPSVKRSIGRCSGNTESKERFTERCVSFLQNNS